MRVSHIKLIFRRVSHSLPTSALPSRPGHMVTDTELGEYIGGISGIIPNLRLIPNPPKGHDREGESGGKMRAEVRGEGARLLG